MAYVAPEMAIDHENVELPSSSNSEGGRKHFEVKKMEHFGIFGLGYYR